jgi:molybdenum cofactor cytidylyltransferase
LLAAIDGKPMVRHTAEAILASAVWPVLVVTGHEAAAIEAALVGLPVSFHHAPDYAEGMSASLKAGVAGLPDVCSGALICLGDMPYIRPDALDRLADAHAGQAALFPSYGGKRGNPVLLARSLFADIMRLTGDQGARVILKSIPDQVSELAVDDPGVLRDVDRPDML